MERIAICPGSFDPITKGHQEIILRARKLFDRVIVVVSENPDKHPVFSVEERVGMIRTVFGGLPGGLLIDYVRRRSAAAIIKGLRAVSDFDYEFQMALTNRKMEPDAETVFLTSSSEMMYLSSSMVRQIARFGGDISPFVPDCILETVSQGIARRYHADI